MINMKITTKRVTHSCKHKKCKIWTTKIKITTTKKVVSNCNQEGGEGKQQLTWRPRARRSQTVISTRDAKQGPLKSKSQWLGRSLVVVAKKEEKENNNQHEDHDQKGHE
jgi:hypothetical protein